MKKIEYKRKMKLIRKNRLDLENRIKSMPCGLDDSICENYFRYENEYLSKKENIKIKKVLDIKEQWDHLENRKNELEYYDDLKTRSKILKIRLGA